MCFHDAAGDRETEARTRRMQSVLRGAGFLAAEAHVEDSIEGLDLKEFFLLLSSTGLAYRRCKLVRVAGDQIGIEFLALGKTNKKQSAK